MLVTALLLTLADGWEKLGLTKPVPQKAGADYIDTEHGHANPLLSDFDGDSKPDLVVGQFQGGKAKVYLNKGTRQAPRFDGFTWVQAGGTEAKVPFG